jgi:thiamine-phosphate pyrophosphorylase
LQNEYELKGIHLTERNPQKPDHYKGCVSCSCESIDKVAQLKKEMDHILLDITSTDLSLLQKDNSKRKLIDKKVFAVGNIDIENASQIAECGFGGIVLQNAIWDKFDIHNTQDFKELINHFRKIRRVVS